MLYCPSDLPADDADAFEAHVQDLRDRVLDHVRELLLELDSPRLAQQVYDLAFDDSEVLPKRESRPKLETALLAEQTYLQFDPSGEHLDELLQFTVLVQEYYDMLDDLIDDDVAPTHENEVLLVSQTLVPMLQRALAALGADATDYWTDRSVDLLTAPQYEATHDPTPEHYAELLARQSVLFGFVTGLSAVVTGQDEDAIQRTERLGRVAYKHAQYVLDYEQYHAGHTEEWNAAELSSEAALIDRLEQWRAEVVELTADYDPERARLVRGLVALDVDEWRRSSRG